MSESRDSAEQIHDELAELDARLTELRALAGRIQRNELRPSDQPLVRELVSQCLAEKLAEAAAEESDGVVCIDVSTRECG